MIGGWGKQCAEKTLVVKHAHRAEIVAVQHEKKRHAESQTLKPLQELKISEMLGHT